MRLIDADALIEQMEAVAEDCEDSICKLVYETDIKEVKRAPTVDAVAVVRCKDCIYSKKFNDEWFQTYMPDMLWCRKYGTKKPEWYCADGERRSE